MKVERRTNRNIVGAFERRKRNKQAPPLTGFEEVENNMIKACQIMGWLCVVSVSILIGIMIL